MIRLFSATDRNFTSNGDIVIQATRAVVHKQDNGDFYLEIEAPSSYAKHFQPLNLIVCDTPQGAQAFRIGKDIKTTRTKVKVKALHVFYDAVNYITSASIVEQTCEDALNILKADSDNSVPFSMASDIETVKSYECEISTLQDAIMELVEIYDGHLVRDNFQITVNKAIGQDNGITIQYGKNLKDIEKTENWDNVCTKVYPLGKDGFTIGFISGPVQYDLPFTKVVQFEQDINEDDYQTEEEYYAALGADLLKQAQDYLEEAYKPSINYTLSANVEKITDVGDIVSVQDAELGISLLAKVLSFEYDAILGQYSLIQFGTVTPELSDLVKTVSDVFDYVTAQDAALASSMENHFYFKTNESITLSKVVCAGWIDSTQKIITFTVPLQKDTNGKTASVSELKVNGFSINGAIWPYSSDGKDVIADSSIAVNSTTQKNSITITLTSSTALLIDASTPLTIEIEAMTATFN